MASSQPVMIRATKLSIRKRLSTTGALQETCCLVFAKDYETVVKKLVAAVSAPGRRPIICQSIAQFAGGLLMDMATLKELLAKHV